MIPESRRFQAGQLFQQTVVAGLLATALAGAAPLAAQSYAIVDTNQTSCYGTGPAGALTRCPAAGEALFGQDAQHASHRPRYRDNGDGTVSDLVTGLDWQKSFTRDVAWPEAAAVAARATTGGHSDWRVPTIKELYSLIDFSGHQGRGNPASRSVPSDARPFIDTGSFDFEYPQTGRYIDAQYISSTAYRGRAMGQSAFFGVNFADGRIKGYPQRGRPGGGGWYLRLVRGNPEYGRNAFRDDGDGTVTDAATGLVWLREDSGAASFAEARTGSQYTDGRMNWPEALAFCEQLSFAGSEEWRLPDAKQLQSLVDYSRSPQSTSSAAIDPLFGVSRIVDESGKSDFPGYWSSTTLLAGRFPGEDAVVVYFGEALGAPWGNEILDVHGAGAQRSDPKIGNPGDYPQSGHGPQGDVRRVYNHVRCVRTADP